MGMKGRSQGQGEKRSGALRSPSDAPGPYSVKNGLSDRFCPAPYRRQQDEGKAAGVQQHHNKDQPLNQCSSLEGEHVRALALELAVDVIRHFNNQAQGHKADAVVLNFFISLFCGGFCTVLVNPGDDQFA